MMTRSGEAALLDAVPGRKKIKMFFAGAGAVAAALSLVVMFVFFNDGVRLLLNRLFEASERVNSYAYTKYAVPEGASCLPAEIALVCSGCGVFLYSMLAKSSVPSVVLAVFLSGFQVYFGLSLPLTVNIILFAVLSYRLMAGCRLNAAILCAVIAALVIVAVVFPGIDEKTEALSEKARDALGTLFEQNTLTAGELPETVMETRPENLRSMMDGNETAVTGDEYRLVTREQIEISKPDIQSIIRIIMLCIAIPLVLLVPFAPFVFMNMRRKKAVQERCLLQEGTNGERIEKTFARVIRWLDVFNDGNAEKLYINRFEDDDEVTDEYLSAYKKAVVIWQEAAYSTHEMSDVQVNCVDTLLEQTEKRFIEKSDWLMRLRLKYVYCLCE